MCSCGSSAREVVCRKVATDKPPASSETAAGSARTGSSPRTAPDARAPRRPPRSVRGEEAWVAGQRRRHADGLRCRQRRIEPCHRPHDRPIRRHPIDAADCRAVYRFGGLGPPVGAGGRRPRPCQQDRARRPGGPTTPQALRPAPAPSSACSTPPSPPPTRRRASSPAASANSHAATGHLSVDHSLLRGHRHRRRCRAQDGSRRGVGGGAGRVSHALQQADGGRGSIGRSGWRAGPRDHPSRAIGRPAV